MKILHTSDWHLGRTLYGRSRQREFELFLDWLTALVESRGIEALIVAGDIFDTTTPSNVSQRLYYQFLHRIALSPQSPCRHIIIVGGNHDSPSFLDAPKDLLRSFDVHVLGAMNGDPVEEVLVLRDADGEPEAVVCAVPYLRDRDIRTVEAGESMEDKNRKLIEGVLRHYAEVARIAEERRQSIGRDIPVIATGHLFTAGGVKLEDDGVRDLYVGSLAHVGASVFPALFDYVALGHLHVPQKVGGEARLRYSGSPIPMGFGEARQRKLVLEVEFAGRVPAVSEIEVPGFQPLEQLTGSLDDVTAAIASLRSAGSSAWLEIDYVGDQSAAVVQEALEAAVEGSLLEIRRIRNNRPLRQTLGQLEADETLEQLDPDVVFERCLDVREIDEALRPALMESYREVLRSIHEDDVRAEEGEAG
ncbi:MAG TPA: exonuclease subunit SbcD [Chlorobaculum parvum]|uniref:Nuclease SbcCD subunit D n=1 Tax=Chlorobaculum parvum TaxID=274539 RepID=A0A7C5DK76_9CHLB|nr:exonuclease subunit SbcD [Chlorobaculum parvum]